MDGPEEGDEGPRVRVGEAVVRIVPVDGVDEPHVVHQAQEDAVGDVAKMVLDASGRVLVGGLVVPERVPVREPEDAPGVVFQVLVVAVEDLVPGLEEGVHGGAAGPASGEPFEGAESQLMDHDGNAKDFIDPYPLSHYYHDGRQFRPIEHQEVRGARIEGDVLVLDLPSGEWAAEIRGDDEVRGYDRHPYDPSFDLEHLAIECYRNKLPEEMLAWREHYVYGTPALRPFSRTMTEEEAKRIDPMGRIPGILTPNGMFNQICECAEKLGIHLKLSHDVPAMENMSMYPNEKKCRVCLRKGNSNWSDMKCWGENLQGTCYGRFMWDRKTPSSRKTSRRDEGEEPCKDNYEQ